jgi:hypothetical protein
MLFTPKKYGKSYRLFLALSFFGGALLFALFAIVTGVGWIAYGELSDQIFAALAFTLAAIVFGAVGLGQWLWFRRMPTR